MSIRQQFETSIDDQQQKPKQIEVLGVDGKYKWPIRIFTPTLFIATLIVNYLLGINRNKEVSDQFSLWVTPPGYFFFIWIVIYSLLMKANIYNLFKNVWSLKTHIIFGISNVLNIIWTLIFNIGSQTSVVIASFILIALTISIYLTWLQMGNIPSEKVNIFTYVMRNIFAFYLGWCIAASNINFGIDIVYWWNGSKEIQMIIFWVMAPLCAVGAFTFNFIKYGKYGALSCFCLWISVAWAFIGAGITSKKCLNEKC